ncbi:putative aconitate hydratase protein [Neofusicoccum parvum]|uniref:Aconitate hydratase protein n=1 Tax=Neofusicoccum parvum TaxID=310453 RepID=A0ACB5RP11_9PEZI|nr:putative aconitate hydratase protein [Neofusicoccum parvum]
MLSRSIIRRSVQGANALLPALPLRARLSTVSHTLEPGNVPDELIRSGVHQTSEPARRPAEAASPSPSSVAAPSTSSASPLPSPTAEAPSQGTTPLSDSVKELLPLLQAQKPHYITAHIHAKPYLLTAGDTLRLPFLMPDVKPGDVLRLNCATILGSRDFTLRAPAPVKGTRERPGTIMQYLDDRLFVCRATVVGTESEPMRVKEKTKRRNRHIKHVKSKHRYTVLKISELEVKTPEEVEAESAKAQSTIAE